MFSPLNFFTLIWIYLDLSIFSYFTVIWKEIPLLMIIIALLKLSESKSLYLPNAHCTQEFFSGVIASITNEYRKS